MCKNREILLNKKQTTNDDDKKKEEDKTKHTLDTNNLESYNLLA